MLKKLNFKIFSSLLICMLSVCAAWAVTDSYMLEGDKVFRVNGDKKVLLEDDEPQRANTESGLWSWILVDPELSEGMKGSKTGIYFFKEENSKPVTFIPMKNAGACMMEFSPSGEKVLISCGTEARQDLTLYFIENGKKFVKQKSFISAGHSFWVDPHRFIFSMIDESKGTRTEGGDDWWCSTALYDSVENEVFILKEATETKDYFITGYDDENGTIDVMEGSVRDKKDWSDQDKIEYKEISVPIPAAG